MAYCWPGHILHISRRLIRCYCRAKGLLGFRIRRRSATAVDPLEALQRLLQTQVLILGCLQPATAYLGLVKWPCKCWVICGHHSVCCRVSQASPYLLTETRACLFPNSTTLLHARLTRSLLQPCSHSRTSPKNKSPSNRL